jgi:hypothetical protein
VKRLAINVAMCAAFGAWIAAAVVCLACIAICEALDGIGNLLHEMRDSQ